MKNADKILKVVCVCRDFLNLDELTEFQGGLKQRDDSDIEKIINSIKDHGIAFPLFVWKHDGINHCLDGHGRILALHRLEVLGFLVPPLPVVFVDCKNERNAKDLLLHINSHYGTMTKESVLEFIGDLDIDTADFKLPFGVIDFVDTEIDLDFGDEVNRVADIKDFFDFTITFPMIYKERLEKYGRRKIEQDIINKLEEM